MAGKIFKQKVLVIEDDSSLLSVLTKVIESIGYEVKGVVDGKSGYAEAITNKYSLIVTDISLPKLSGHALFEMVKADGIKTPVMMITNFSAKDSELRSYSEGASLFHKKPINFTLFKAQVKMLLEKNRFRPDLSLGDITVNPGKSIVVKAGERVFLTKKEFDLLLTLLSSPGEIFTRREIIELTHMNVREVDEGSVDTLISRVRGKLGKYKGDEVIETVYRRGYKLSQNYLE